jgi:hypothetical protein
VVRAGRLLERVAPCLVLVASTSCRDADRFDTSGDDAFCGSIVDAKFVRTTPGEGATGALSGLERNMRMRLEIDAENLSTIPGELTTDDTEAGPCAPVATFDKAPLLVTPETLHDPLSQLTFGEAQEQNLLTWVRSCRGPMIAIVSLLASDDIEVRLLEPPTWETDSAPRPAFALFELSRRAEDCGF